MLQPPLPLQILLRAPLHLTGNILYSIMGAENPDYYYICILATTLSTILALLHAALLAWNNGKEVPRWGVAEIQKMSPSTTGRCYCCH